MQSLISTRPIEYAKLKTLGEGSSGIVYHALRKDVEFGIEQAVAVKILKSQIDVDSFRSEFSLLSQVTSSRCVRLLGWDRLDDRPALILELIDGVTLDKLIREAPLSVAENDEIISQIFEGLQDISRAGLSHGDLSLKNVMVTTKGEVKILDFGLFKGGRGQFTPEFAAPEIFELAAPTFFSDLYSLGRIQYFIETQVHREISPMTLRLLAMRPEDRDFTLPYIEPPVRARRREALAQMVIDVKRRQNLIKHVGTSLMTTILSARRTFQFRKIGLIPVFFMAMIAGPATADRRPAYIYIRTKSWAQITLNGEPKGYSPMDLPVPTGETVELKVKMPSGEILRTLTLKPGQNMVLDDRSFMSGVQHGQQLVE